MCAALALCATGATRSMAGTAGASVKADQPPIVITAGSLIADNKKKTVVYQKAVVVKRGDITMYADEVTVRLSPSGKTEKPGTEDAFKGAGKVDTIEAKGGVKIVQQDKTATADEAVYYSSTDKLVLTGNPRVWQGDNVLSGTVVTYDIKEDTFLVEGARTILYQEKKTP